MTAAPESIHNLDEAMVLGYFETVRSAFLVKVAAVALLSDNTTNGAQIFRHLLIEVAKDVGLLVGDTMTPKALQLGNNEVHQNLLEDAIGGLLMSSWSVFEQVIKDLINPNYAGDPVTYVADFQRRVFGFTKAEKDDIAFFYYLRNCMAHYNGAYNAYKTIDHTYEGQSFKSVGHTGEKIIISPKLVASICNDLERYSLKAWNAAKAASPGATTP